MSYSNRTNSVPPPPPQQIQTPIEPLVTVNACLSNVLKKPISYFKLFVLNPDDGLLRFIRIPRYEDAPNVLCKGDITNYVSRILYYGLPDGPQVAKAISINEDQQVFHRGIPDAKSISSVLRSMNNIIWNSRDAHAIKLYLDTETMTPLRDKVN
jgi:hypothetical protein